MSDASSKQYATMLPFQIFLVFGQSRKAKQKKKGRASYDDCNPLVKIVCIVLNTKRKSVAIEHNEYEKDGSKSSTHKGQSIKMHLFV